MHTPRAFRYWLVALASLALLLGAACGDDSADSGAATDDSGSEETIATEDECLITEDLSEGDGPEAKSGQIVTVHYTGTLEDGSEFDSSRGKDPLKFALGTGQVIEGWDEGVQGMKVGGTRKLTICSDMAYGDTGYPPVIPGGATLIFEVELLDVQKA